MKTTKQTKRNATGMDEKAKAEWRAAKSAQLDARVAALKKLAASPDPTPKAKKPARSFPPPADALTAPTTPAAAPTTAPVPEVAATAPDGPIHEGTAYGDDGAKVTVTIPPDEPETPAPGDRHAAAAGGQEQNGGKGDKPKRTRKAAGERKPREGGCLNIAARLLAEATESMTTKALIESMAAKGLWTSPGGKTPAATLYAAILREIRDKGDAARFRKMDRGLFSARTPTNAKI